MPDDRRELYLPTTFLMPGDVVVLDPRLAAEKTLKVHEVQRDGQYVVVDIGDDNERWLAAAETVKVMRIRLPDFITVETSVLRSALEGVARRGICPLCRGGVPLTGVGGEISVAGAPPVVKRTVLHESRYECEWGWAWAGTMAMRHGEQEMAPHVEQALQELCDRAIPQPRFRPNAALASPAGCREEEGP